MRSMRQPLVSTLAALALLAAACGPEDSPPVRNPADFKSTDGLTVCAAGDFANCAVYSADAVLQTVNGRPLGSIAVDPLD